MEKGAPPPSLGLQVATSREGQHHLHTSRAMSKKAHWLAGQKQGLTKVEKQNCTCSLVFVLRIARTAKGMPPKSPAMNLLLCTDSQRTLRHGHRHFTKM